MRRTTDSDFGHRIDVTYDLKFPKKAEQVATLSTVYRKGKHSDKTTVQIGVMGNRLYIEQLEYRRRQCIAVEDYNHYMASEVALRLDLCVGLSVEAIRLAKTLIYQLYKDNGLPIICFPSMRTIKK